MLARLLKIWLIVSILGYGMALAADVHGDTGGDHDVHLLDGKGNMPDENTDDSGCHHCAHGVSHLLGLAYLGGISIPVSRCISCASCESNWSSLSPPSLLRPPIHS